MDTAFKDHFSAGTDAYARFRPGYPAALFAWLARIAPDCELAWDCGCGSGQAARGLAAHFRTVEATDASAEQIAAASGPENLHFRVARAEASGLADRSVDLVCVAQALHWFDHDRFFVEVRRVARPDAVIAAIAYDLPRVDEDVDALVLRLYREITRPYWPPERRYFDEGYAASIPFPFPRIEAPAFRMETDWSVGDLLGHLRTWSGVKRYESAHGHDPVGIVEADLRSMWGEGRRPTRWPLALVAGRI